MPLKGLTLKWQNVISLSCNVLELLRKPRGEAESAPPGIDRVKAIKVQFFQKI